MSLVVSTLLTNSRHFHQHQPTARRCCAPPRRGVPLNNPFKDYPEAFLARPHS